MGFGLKVIGFMVCLSIQLTQLQENSQEGTSKYHTVGFFWCGVCGHLGLADYRTLNTGPGPHQNLKKRSLESLTPGTQTPHPEACSFFVYDRKSRSIRRLTDRKKSHETLNPQP